MSKIEDGGPAYPHPGGAGDFTVQESHLGMTLRDWFAGQALAGMVANPQSYVDGNAITTMATASYLLADAMLAARSKDRSEP